MGSDAAFAPGDAALATTLRRLTDGAGADVVFIAASSSTSEPVELAASLARDRARVIGVGKTLLNIPYTDYYGKELEYRFSRSYGPGRYDPNYEERGIDYPVGYVRWTERRNMASFLDLVSQHKIQLDPLISSVFPFDQAESVYQDIADGKLAGIGFLFEYSCHTKETVLPAPTVSTSKKIFKTNDLVRFGFIGAGNYASSMLLPNLAGRKDVKLVEVATTSALSGANAVRKFPFERTGTDYKALLAADDVDAVVIATRHAAHAEMAAEALRRGKAVFVEKPLAIDVGGAEMVRTALLETGNERLQVGFNRRFSPLARSVEELFRGFAGPLVMHYRVHAGSVDAKSWYGNGSEGSRFIGEAGHFFDVFSFLSKARPVAVFAQAIRPEHPTPDDLENMAVVVHYDNGSVGNLLYLTQGSGKVPKEFLEVFGAGKTAQLNNFESADLYDGVKHRRIVGGTMNKGQREELEAFVRAVKGNGEMPISMQSLLDTTLVTLAAAESLRASRQIQLSEYWMK